MQTENKRDAPGESSRLRARWIAAPAIALAAALGVGAATFLPQASAQEQKEEAPAPESEDGETRDGCHMKGPRGPGLSTAAEAIGIEPEQLLEELRSGKSMAQVAEENGVSVEDLTSALVSAMEERLDAAVAAGRLTQEEADEKKAEAAERIGEMVQTEGLPHRGPRGHGGFGGPPPDSDAEAEESSLTTA